MSRTVSAHVRFLPDRSMQVTVDGPDGPVDAGITRRSADIGRMARDAAQVAFAQSALDLDVQVVRPPWLREGMLVEVSASALDPDEHSAHAYGQIMGFVAVGGVLVMRPEAGAGVYAPEDLTGLTSESVPRRFLDDIVARTGISPA